MDVIDASPDTQQPSRADMTEPVRLVLKYPISANRYWRPVSMGKRLAMVPTKDAKAYRNECACQAKASGLRTPTRERVAVHIVLHPAKPKDWVRRAKKDPDRWDDSVRCMDLGNCEKVAMDALNGVVWFDDAQVWDMHLVRGQPLEQGALVVTIRVLARGDLFGADPLDQGPEPSPF